MKNKLVLHIGIHKTGSTSIQHFLYGNRSSLTGQGYYYPTEGTYYYHGERSQSLLAHSIFGNRPAYLGNLKFDRHACVSDIRRDLQRSNSPNAIISSEHFSLAETARDFALVKDVFLGLFENIQIIVYLRRQDLFLESTWGEWVKNGSTTQKIDAMLGHRSLKNYYTFVKAATEVFGPSNVVVRPFERAQLFGNDVVRDFVRVVGLTCEVPDGGMERLNSSPPAEFIELLRILNRKVENPDDRRQLAHFLGRVPFSYDRTRYSLLSHAARRQILDSFRESNARVAAEFLGRMDGKLFLEPEESVHPVYTGLTTDRMIEFLSSAMLRLVKANIQLTARLSSAGPARQTSPGDLDHGA